ncbi:Lissencephaly-1-like protein, partial [Thalictrum thalictroides]
GACLFEQKASDATVTSDKDDTTRGFTSAVVLPLDQGLLCVTSDEQFLFYSPIQSPENTFELKLRKRLVGNNEEIIDMKFLGDEEQFLAVATNVEQVRLWDQESHCCIGVGIGHLGAVGAVAFSKKKRNFIVSGSSDRTLKVWSLDGLMVDSNLPINLKSKAVMAAHEKEILSVAVAPNDSYVCSGSEDRTACVWKLPDLVSIVVLRGHKKGIWSVEFSPVDQCVITASGDKTIKLWAISDGSCLKTFEGHTSSVSRASFISRGTQFVSCGADCLVKLWVVKTNECIATYDQHEHK